MFLSWICHRIQQDSTHCDRSVLHFPGAGNAQTDLDCSDICSDCCFVGLRCYMLLLVLNQPQDQRQHISK